MVPWYYAADEICFIFDLRYFIDFFDEALDLCKGAIQLKVVRYFGHQTFLLKHSLRIGARDRYYPPTAE